MKRDMRMINMKKRSIQIVPGRTAVTKVGSQSRGVQEQHTRHYGSGKVAIVNRGLNKKSPKGPVILRPRKAELVLVKPQPLIKLRPRLTYDFYDKRTFLEYLERNFSDEGLMWANQNEDDWENAVFDEWISFIDREEISMTPEAVKKFVDDREYWESSIMEGRGGQDAIVWYFYNDKDAPIKDSVVQDVFSTGFAEEDGVEYNYYYDPFDGKLTTHEPGVVNGYINKKYFSIIAVVQGTVDLREGKDDYDESAQYDDKKDRYIPHTDREMYPAIFELLDELNKAGIPFAATSGSAGGGDPDTVFVTPKEYSDKAKIVFKKIRSKYPGVDWK
jgi:hypothetical protein